MMAPAVWTSSCYCFTKIISIYVALGSDEDGSDMICLVSMGQHVKG